MARTITVQSTQDINIVSNVISSMLNNDNKLTVTVKKYDETISDKQRRIYWKWVSIIGDEIGNTKHEQHLELKHEFLLGIFLRNPDKHPIVNNGWEDLQLFKQIAPDRCEGLHQSVMANVSIMDASVTEMREYLTEIDALARWQGINLPRNDDGYYEAMGVKR